MDAKEQQIKHLEAIQSVINRLAQNSFTIKGWSVVLVSALFALAAYKANIQFVVISLLPIFVFWFLDGYYLWQERRFRAFYNHVRVTVVENPQEFFSMDVSPCESEAGSIWCAWFSGTLLLFYGGIIFAIILVWNLAATKGVA